MILIITRDAERTHAQHKKNIIETFFSEEINEENVKKFFNVERNDLSYCAIIQQFRRNDVRETCNDEQQMKSPFKLLMIKLEKL